MAFFVFSFYNQYFYFMISSKEYDELKLKTLNLFWGYQHFREEQEEIIDSLMSGKDTLALLPTGGGKSLCYQLPALISEGVCLVVSPLIALMRDQVIQLKYLGIDADYLSADLDDFEIENILTSCKEGIVKILYISPERLSNRFFRQQIEEVQVSFIAVDEAHCISEWGQDFRPSYQNIKFFRNDIKHVPILALTATATSKVLTEIQTKLELKNANVFQKSFIRSNISIFSEKIADKYSRILNLLKYSNNSGLIYTRTRKEAEELSSFLQNNGISNVDFFHAGLSSKEKHLRQQKWLQSSNQVLVATNAFGMGIDKDNVRFVVHFSPAPSVENYYQEIGRSGRDGKESSAFLLWNDQELQNFDQILKNQIPNKEEFKKIITLLYGIFQIPDAGLPEKVFQLDAERLRKLSNISMAKIKNVLTFLHNQEIIYYSPTKTLSSLELKISAAEAEQLPKKDGYLIELLLRNLPGVSAQKVFFSELNLSRKIGTEAQLLKQRLREVQKSGYLDYIDGSLASIKFLKRRDDRSTDGADWNLFKPIQQNKLQKWNEMKFYTQDTEVCKMKQILHYFDEKKAKNCGKCFVCRNKKESIFGSDISSEIIEVLQEKPSTIEEISVRLNYFRKEMILENLIILLDSGKVKMLNFRTYTLVKI